MADGGTTSTRQEWLVDYVDGTTSTSLTLEHARLMVERFSGATGIRRRTVTTTTTPWHPVSDERADEALMRNFVTQAEATAIGNPRGDTTPR